MTSISNIAGGMSLFDVSQYQKQASGKPALSGTNSASYFDKASSSQSGSASQQNQGAGSSAASSSPYSLLSSQISSMFIGMQLQNPDTQAPGTANTTATNSGSPAIGSESATDSTETEPETLEVGGGRHHRRGHGGQGGQQSTDPLTALLDNNNTSTSATTSGSSSGSTATTSSSQGNSVWLNNLLAQISNGNTPITLKQAAAQVYAQLQGQAMHG